MKAPAPQNWHEVSSAEALVLLESDEVRGLSGDEVARRLEQFGPNQMSAGKRTPWLRFLLQFHQPLIYILLAAALVTSLLASGWMPR
jgi:cation-transporting P-type ATPase F